MTAVSRDTAASPNPPGRAVQARDAGLRVGSRVLWRGVTLTVERGEFAAILGPNGSGKSSLLKVILGLLHLSEGVIEVLGRPPGAANQHIGYLPQRRSFDPGLRIRGVDVVRLGLDGLRWGVPLPGAERWSRRAAQDRDRVREVIDVVGASGYAERPIGQLSGGEQQRLLIAQALVREPKLLLLDEPLDGLDLPNQAAVSALIRRICSERGVTVLMVAHDVNPILPYLSQVIYIAAGRIISGNPGEVMTSDTLSRLFSTAVEVLRASDGRLVVVGEPEGLSVHIDRHGGHGGDT